jgi:hypothetical protein
MTRIRMSDFKAFFGDKSLDSLYHALLNVAKAEPGGEVIRLDVGSLKGDAFRQQWNEWVLANPGKVLGTIEQPTPESQLTESEMAAIKAVVAKTAAEDQAKLDAAKAEENKAIARLDEWAEPPYGLILNDYNLQVLRDHFQQNVLPFNSANVDAAVNALKDKLQFAVYSLMLRPAEEPQPKEVLGKLRNGEKQLPLASTQADLRRASKEQVADWLERTREATNQKYIRGSHSHSVGFITPTMN